MADVILFDGDTRLEHYQVIDTIYEGRPARVLYSGQRHTAQSGVATDDSPELLFDYNQRYLEVLDSITAKRILLIGGGAYTFPMAVLQRFPGLQVDVVEIDPGLKTIAEKYFGLRESPRLHINHAEGSEYLRATAMAYDAIFVDAFTKAAMPETLTNRGTIRQLRGHLTPDGVVAVNIISPYMGPNSGLIKSQVREYRKYFRTVSVYPAGRSLFSLWLPQNLVLVAQKSEAHTLALRYGALEPSTDELTK